MQVNGNNIQQQWWQHQQQQQHQHQQKRHHQQHFENTTRQVMLVSFAFPQILEHFVCDCISVGHFNSETIQICMKYYQNKTPTTV